MKFNELKNQLHSEELSIKQMNNIKGGKSRPPKTGWGKPPWA